MWAQFTKLRLWEQMQYEKIVYLDSDIIVVADISALFDILHSPLAAARGTDRVHRCTDSLMVQTLTRWDSSANLS